MLIGGSKNNAIFFLVLLAALAALFFRLPPLGLQSGEEGVAFIQMKAFALHGSPGIPFPAQKFGFTADDLAGLSQFFVSSEGELRATTPALFPFLSSLFHPLLGDRVAHLLPLAFLFLATVVLGMTLRLVMAEGLLYYLLLLSFLASPVFLQAFGFTGVTAALFLETLALYWMVRYFRVSRSHACLFGSAFALGTSLLLCPGFLFMAAAWTVAVALHLLVEARTRDAALFLSGALAVLALWILGEVFIYGTFPGPSLGRLAPQFALSPVRLLVFALVMFLVGVFRFAVRRYPPASVVRKAAWVAALLLFAGAVLVTSARLSLIPFLLQFPALLLVFLGLPARIESFRGQDGRPGLALTLAVLLCLILASSARENESASTLVFFLPVIPCVAMLFGLERERIFAAPAVTHLLVFAIAVSMAGGYIEARLDVLKVVEYNDRRVAFLEQKTSRHDVVVFAGAPLMELAGPLFFERICLVARQDGDVEKIVKTLMERKVGHFYLWSGDPFDIARWGNPVDRESYRKFPGPSGGSSSCNGNYHLIRVHTDEAMKRKSGNQRKANDGNSACHAKRPIEYGP